MPHSKLKGGFFYYETIEKKMLYLSMLSDYTLVNIMIEKFSVRFVLLLFVLVTTLHIVIDMGSILSFLRANKNMVSEL